MKVDEAYKNQEGWTKSSIISTAFSGKFNSDRTIDQYAKVGRCRLKPVFASTGSDVLSLGF